MNDVGARLRAYRERTGLTQSELASRTGVSAGTIRDLEQGRTRRPHPKSLGRLRAALAIADEEAPEPPAAGPATVAILGPLTVDRKPLAGGRVRTLLGRLAVAAAARVSRDELIDCLWPEDPPPSAVSLIHTYVARLRRLLGEAAVAIAPGGYRLTLDASRLDLLAFRAHLAEARAVSGAAALDRLEAALDLCRGPALADLDALRPHPAVVGIAAEQVDAVLRHAVAAADAGCHDRSLPYLSAAAEADPLHELVHGHLMVALAAAGRQSDALRAYDEIHRRLDDELGLAPSTQLRDFRDRVLRRQWVTGPRPMSPRTAPFQTPAPVIDFVGRQTQLSAIDRAFIGDQHRAVPGVPICAISGVPGVGKTTLAVRAAHRLRERYPDGQLYANLDGAGVSPSSPMEVLSRFLRALGVDGATIPHDLDESAALFRTRLIDRRMLLILDNAKDAGQIRPLLPGHGGCGVLVTSRRRLADLEGARLVELGAMASEEALALLSAVAGADRVGRDAPAVVRVVQACGALPLAIRIAGVRLANRASWTVQVLDERLRDQRHRLDELRAGDLEVRASVRLSYRSLEPRTAEAFSFFGIAPVAELRPDSAAALLGCAEREAERLLDDLVDASLMDTPAPDRFRYHDLVRLFAAETAATLGEPGELTAAVRRLLDFYYARVAAVARLQHPNMVRLPCEAAEHSFTSRAAAIDWLQADLPEVVAAVVHAAQHGPADYAWRIADQLRGFFFYGRHTAEWFTTSNAGLAAAVRSGNLSGQAAMHQTLGQAHWSVGELRRSLEHYQEALDLARRCGWTLATAYLLHNIGLVELALGDHRSALGYYTRSLAECTTAAHAYVRAVTLNDLGMLSREMGRLPDALRFVEEAWEINHRAGDDAAETVNSGNLGMILREMGRLDEAMPYLHRSLAAARAAGFHVAAVQLTDEVAQAHLARGEHAEAGRLSRASLTAVEAMGDRASHCGVLITLGEALLAGGSHAAALTHLREALRLAAEVDAPHHRTRAQIVTAEAEALVGMPGAAERAYAALDAAQLNAYRILEARALTLLSRIGPPPDRARLRDAADRINAEAGVSPAGGVTER
ncbi:tetratricopeptide repeat protein [Actinoplanes teichomyceticus]|uniref:DNA-binding SARP family transcriptional activator n=1 Tax=Actinoplanes teichomyceticus TaxID=1867 RepID=A0A561VRV9_ACTTI|nr:tetratricopeptide repeat protein [Actinoplanes teichomyceticus]TWG14365.1 DNA-binding SARP family transcriptional activator [Actinoplanes teichomyceticus]GIF13077.1 XRE family transcriptional regulator [Actinoplanes teichomyceticus]